MRRWSSGASDEPILETYLLSSHFGDSSAGIEFLSQVWHDCLMRGCYVFKLLLLVGIKISNTDDSDIIRHAERGYLLRPHDLEGSSSC